MVGMGTWRKPKPLVSISDNRGGNLAECFPMPPIPIILNHSFLFLLTCSIVSAEKTKGGHWKMDILE
ncbi:hypothetical protein DAI22_04g135601 [Oryza sativa Japonica Group]|nr:hypothetical protein DAI22_04g135601 [Oryza sativa Japonica Group]